MGDHLGKVDDLVEFLVELLARHAKDGGINVNVLAPGEVGNNARADLDRRGDAAIDPGRAAGGFTIFRLSLWERRPRREFRADACSTASARGQASYNTAWCGRLLGCQAQRIGLRAVLAGNGATRLVCWA